MKDGKIVMKDGKNNDKRWQWKRRKWWWKIKGTERIVKNERDGKMMKDEKQEEW